jgi:hypothetical protein
VLIYVEDDSAQEIVNEIIARYLAAAGKATHPSYQVIPVGGYANVVRFFDIQKPLLPAMTRAHVILDADAQATLTAAQQPDLRAILLRRNGNISYLPFTPEVGLIDLLTTRLPEVIDALRAHFHLNALTIAQADVIASDQQLPGNRDRCKNCIRDLCEALAEVIPNGHSVNIKRVLMKILGTLTFEHDRPVSMTLIAPIFN